MIKFACMENLKKLKYPATLRSAFKEPSGGAPIVLRALQDASARGKSLVHTLGANSAMQERDVQPRVEKRRDRKGVRHVLLLGLCGLKCVWHWGRFMLYALCGVVEQACLITVSGVSVGVS